MIRVDVQVGDDIWEADFETDGAADAWINEMQSSGTWGKLPDQWVRTLPMGQDRLVTEVRFVRVGFQFIPEYRLPGAIKKTDITKMVQQKRALDRMMLMKYVGEQCIAKIWIALNKKITSEGQLMTVLADLDLMHTERILRDGLLGVGRKLISALPTDLFSSEDIAEIVGWIDQSGLV